MPALKYTFTETDSAPLFTALWMPSIGFSEETSKSELSVMVAPASIRDLNKDVGKIKYVCEVALKYLAGNSPLALEAPIMEL